MSALRDGFVATLTSASDANLSPYVTANTLPHVGTSFPLYPLSNPGFSTGTNLTSYLSGNSTPNAGYNIFSPTPSSKSSLSFSYALGELSGAYALAGKLATNTITLTVKGLDYNLWGQGTGNTFSYSHELSHLILSEWSSWQNFIKYLPVRNIEDWETDFILSALSRLRENATHIILHSTELHAELKDAATACVLAMVWIVTIAIAAAVRSIFIFIITTAPIIKTIMAHKNSREPAYRSRFAPSSISFIGGLALTH